MQSLNSLFLALAFRFLIYRYLIFLLKKIIQNTETLLSISSVLLTGQNVILPRWLHANAKEE